MENRNFITSEKEDATNPEYMFRSLESEYMTYITVLEEKIQAKTLAFAGQQGHSPTESTSEIIDPRVKFQEEITTLLLTHAQLVRHLDQMLRHPLHKSERDPEHRGPTRQLESAAQSPKGGFFPQLKAKWNNCRLGLLVAYSLLIPMTIMAWENSFKAHMLTVYFATLLFGLAVGWSVTTREAVIASVAAYAAVMVIYVGSASPAGS